MVSDFLGGDCGCWEGEGIKGVATSCLGVETAITVVISLDAMHVMPVL